MKRGGRGGGGRGGRGGMKGGSKVVIEQHRHEGVFIARGKEDALVTKNLVPGGLLIPLHYVDSCLDVVQLYANISGFRTDNF
jgi:hypothetical protein